MLHRLAVLSVCGLAALSWSCAGESASASQSAPAQPDQAVLASVGALRQNDLGKLLQLALPPAELAELEQQWQATKTKPVTPQEAQEFASAMEMLTASGAEQALMAKLEPQLAQMEPQLEMMVGMMSGMIASGIQENEMLDESEKAESQAMLESFAAFLAEGHVLDRDKARQAIAIVCKAARSLELESLEQFQGLSFDQMLGKGDVGLAAVKDILAVYGLSIDAMLDSMTVETISETGDEAIVAVKFELFGKQQSVQSTLTRVGGRWTRQQSDSERVAQSAR